ncbi:hypothetical protein E2C01_086841 [Portunus trituberculatus]|uniref:Uncharacterized protein n=1 Tax=Portunus trituberculatus TaxID=210409 RepID=A0A5B7JBM3_PORTR|nr:hypothetical protein [Portunus trituberculatus]
MRTLGERDGGGTDECLAEKRLERREKEGILEISGGLASTPEHSFSPSFSSSSQQEGTKPHASPANTHTANFMRL